MKIEIEVDPDTMERIKKLTEEWAFEVDEKSLNQEIRECLKLGILQREQERKGGK